MAKVNDESGFIDLVFEELTPEEMNSRADSFYQEMNKRRTTRLSQHARCRARLLKRQSKPLELHHPELIYNLGHSWRFLIRN